MKHIKPGAAKADSDARKRSADRALFEEAVERLRSTPPEKAETDETVAPGAARRGRFTKRAARGELEPDAKIDLHGLDRDTATARLRSFLSSVGGEAEVLLVVHGRGEGILAAAAVVELDQHPRVAEHLPAPGKWGGAGARLVRLRRRDR
jgi:dsDNA-specific endonuclease/ATPase MutS2